MQYNTSQDRIDEIYNENIQFLDDPKKLSSQPILVDISSIKAPSLVEKYKNDEEQSPSIQNFIESFKKGLPVGPLVIDRENNLIDGCHRYIACEAVGITSVLCLRLDELLPLSDLD